jgi:NAD(P)-dependent dehydrogenase (short-subunit alcohol dehydrogenase family)
MTYDLKGKAVVLTGGSRGIGRRVAVAMAREDARLAVMARDVNALQETLLAVEAVGSKAVPIRCDVTDETSVRSAIGKAALSLDGIDVFMNIAGITLQKRLLEATDEDMLRIMETNLLGALRCCRYALPFLRARRGVLVNVASIIVSNPFPHMGVYACSKWALAALSHTLRQELHGSGVRVLTVYPAVVRTDMLAEEPVLARTPSQSPESCARAIVRAVKKGKRETGTAWLPKITGALFKLHPPWCDRINRLLLPRAFK